MVRKIDRPDVLSPDGSGRFFMMVALLELFYGGRKNVTLLDVGGSSSYMTQLLKNATFSHDTTAIDILPKPFAFSGTYVQGDATNMTFGDNSFDTVISTDVLEHIPLQKKDDFVKECIRVAKEYVIIAAPYDTEGVDQAEHATNDFNKRLFKEGQAWLEEHFENKKPNLKRVVKIAEDMGCEASVIGTNNLYLWLLSTHTNLIDAKLGLDGKRHIKENMLLNDAILTSGDMTPPYYRHFVVIAKQKQKSALNEKLTSLSSPDIDHAPTIRYVHELMNLIEETMSKQVVEISKLKKEMNEAVQQRQDQIEALQREMQQKDELIQRSRHYLKLQEFHPKRLASRFRRSDK